MVLIVTAELNFDEKLALVPDAPVPVFPNSWNVTASVFGVAVLQIDQPAPLITDPITVFCTTTRAHSDQGRPRYAVPVLAVVGDATSMEDLLIT